MKREAKLLLNKACDSLTLGIEFFNRPYERGRVSSTFILLDHAFEMLLKAAILQKGGGIREQHAKETIGFDKCVRRGFSDEKIKFLTEEQALLLQSINGQRDAAQHHLLDISEGQHYLLTQAGVTLFRDLLRTVFNKELSELLPKRVLPVSTIAPTDLVTLFDHEIAEIKKLLKPGRRKRIEAEARLRPLAILDGAIQGLRGQPSEQELGEKIRKLSSGNKWSDLFPGVAAVEITTEGSGPNISLRLSKKEGMPVNLVPEGTPNAAVVGVKRVNELDFYSLSAKNLAEKLDLTPPKACAVVRYLGIQNDIDCFKAIKIGKATFNRYSPKAIDAIKTGLQQRQITADEIWQQRKK